MHAYFIRCTVSKSIILMLTMLFSLSLPSWAVESSAAKEAKSLLDRLGVNVGIVCVLGLSGSDQAAFPIDLARAGDKITVYFQSPSADEVAAVRQAASKAELLGIRVFVDRGDWDRIHLADNLADMVVVPTLAKGTRAPPLDAEILRVLHPRAKALIGDREIVKPVPDGFDSWEHPFHGPDNNPVSTDEFARVPYITQFVAAPVFSPQPQVSVASAGRIFKFFGHLSSQRDTTDLVNKLLAINSYNGTILWERPLKEGFMWYRNTMVATPSALYVADDESCEMLDAVTGELQRKIVLPEDVVGERVWKWIALEGGVLYALLGGPEEKTSILRESQRRIGQWDWRMWNKDRDTYQESKTGYGFGHTLVAYDIKTDKVRWTHQEETLIDGRSMCMTGGRLFFYSPEKRLGSINALDGSLVWKNETQELLAVLGPDFSQGYMGYAPMPYVKCAQGTLLFAGPSRPYMVAVSATDGKLLWHREDGYQHLVLRPEAIYSFTTRRGFSVPSKKRGLVTQSVKIGYDGKELGVLGNDLFTFCGRVTASVDSMFLRRAGGTRRYDIPTGKVEKLWAMRPPCIDGVLISDGMLFFGPWMCVCGSHLLGHVALGPAGDFDFHVSRKDRLPELGSDGINIADASDTTPLDWTHYRHDAQWSSATTVRVPDSVEVAWIRRCSSGWLSAPTTAYGIIFVGGQDGIVNALDAKTGDLRWKSATSGAVNFPPVIWKGRVFAGSCDGRAYAYEATTGRLLWRFTAAPVDRWIPVDGALASTWPVSSGAVIDKEKLHIAAGMAHYDGTNMYELDPVSGKVVSHKVEQRFSVMGGIRVAQNKQGNAVPLFPTQGQTMFYQRRYWPALQQAVFSDGRAIVVHKKGIEFSLYSKMKKMRPVGEAIWTSKDVIWPEGTGEIPSYGGFVNTANLLLVSGAMGGKENSAPCIAALNMEDGSMQWIKELPAPVVRWGMAVDSDGRIILALEDGRVICLAGKGSLSVGE